MKNIRELTPYFEKYEALVSNADDAFERVKQAHAECVKCKEKCTDCCYALFDLTLIEALYINHKFKEKISGGERAELLEKANEADRKVHKLKRRAYKDLQAGKSENEILTDLAREQIREADQRHGRQDAGQGCCQAHSGASR